MIVTEPMETIHIYFEREKEPKQPNEAPVIATVFVLLFSAGLLLWAWLVPAATPQTITIPVRMLLPRYFSQSLTIIPTGVKIYPATIAHGTLTITNGSVISQTLPAGVILVSNSGVSVITDQAVYVPAGSANGYGMAYVSAHALISGRQGNIPVYVINSAEGSSVYIRNLSAFHGGRDSYSVRFITVQDRQTALIQARAMLTIKGTGLHYPCVEAQLQTVVTWRCQFVSYVVPPYVRVLSVQLTGNHLILSVWYIGHPKQVWVR